MVARARVLVLAVLMALVAACADPGAANGLRFSVVPDANKAQLAVAAEALARMLAAQLGVPVRYVPSNDYAACVNGLVADKLDFVWLGGKTTCDALDLGQGHVHVLATRDIDLHFRSHFIGNRETIAAGRLAPLASLADWRGHTEGLRFTFGDVDSTSGHLMPRHFLGAAGIDPEREFASVGYAQGGHAGTLQAVASGAVDCGALNFAFYDRAEAALRERAPILFTTPEYVDYAWVVHDRIGPLADRLRELLLALDAADAAQGAILRAWSAGRFVPAEDGQWQAIRAVRDSLPKGFLK